MPPCKIVNTVDLLRRAKHIQRLLLARAYIEIARTGGDDVKARCVEQRIIAAQGFEERYQCALVGFGARKHFFDGNVDPNLIVRRWQAIAAEERATCVRPIDPYAAFSLLTQSSD
jgi:hypothetical protein